MLSLDQICLMQFAKLPSLGLVKTRMQPYLDEHRSLLLHKRLVTYSADIYSKMNFASYQLHYGGKIDKQEHFSWLQQLQQDYGCELVPQRGSDLGSRMAAAMSEALTSYPAAIIVGSDCPFIDERYISLVLRSWKSNTVFIPALDGGYVLIGMRRLEPAAFDNIPWGTDRVMALSRQNLTAKQASWDELSPLSDIDEFTDLKLLSAIPQLAEFAS